MGLHAQAHQFQFPERRIATRSRVSCPVRLQLPSGSRSGCMIDISERGARIQLPHPPGAGASVLLEWLCHDALCRVAWSNGDECGLLFDRPISMARVIELEQYREEFSGPVAEVCNIPLGRKRSRIGG